MAVAAWAGLTKSTKQRISGSPPGCKDKIHQLRSIDFKSGKSNINKQLQTYMSWFLAYKSYFFVANKRTKNICQTMWRNKCSRERWELRQPINMVTIERIRETSRRVQSEGNPSTYNVLEASGGRGISALPPPNPRVLSFALTPGSKPPIPPMRGSSTERPGIPPLVGLADCPPP